ncbi:hypothetical protein D3C73_673930 [compost metagenome]
MVTRQVETGAAQQGFGGVHVAFGAAGEHRAFEKIRDTLLQLGNRQAPDGPGPVRFVTQAFAEKQRAQARHGAFQACQFVAEDDVLGRARTVHEDDIQVGMQVGRRTGHGHQRGDARAGGQVQQLARRAGNRRENTRRA